MTALTRWEPFKTRWDPWKEFEEMEKRLSTYFGRQATRTSGDKEAMTVAEVVAVSRHYRRREGIRDQG